MTLVSQKCRYQKLLSTGLFVKFSFEQLDCLHDEVRTYLRTTPEPLDAVELFDICELQFHLLLLTNRDVEAKLLLDRFNSQFAQKKSQKLAVLHLMYYEALGDNDRAHAVLSDDPDELRSSRRLMTLSRRSKDGELDTPEYIKSLNFYLSLQASDTLAWAELADVYHSIGEYDKAVYCYKEVLLQKPMAYNIFYKAGLSLYYQHLAIVGGGKMSRKEMILKGMKVLEHSRDCFLRSVEISESYTKGWVGAYIVASTDFVDTLRANKSSSGVAAVDRFLVETEKIKELSKRRIFVLEDLDSDLEFDLFLKR